MKNTAQLTDPAAGSAGTAALNEVIDWYSEPVTSLDILLNEKAEHKAKTIMTPEFLEQIIEQPWYLS